MCPEYAVSKENLILFKSRNLNLEMLAYFGSEMFACFT